MENKYIRINSYENNINNENNVNILNYILCTIFIFLVGFNIFFIEYTKNINDKIIEIKNITNIPYDIFNIDVNYNVLILDILFMISAIIISIQIIFLRNKSILYIIPFIVILYFLIPSLQINYIINTISLIKKQRLNENTNYDIKEYIISSSLYVSSYTFYTIGLIYSFFRTKI
jgi:hypothetical protein